MIHSMSEIQKAYDILKAVVERENKLHLMDMTINTCDVEMIEYEVLPVLDDILGYEPSDEELGGESPMTANEMHTAAHKQHMEMHS
jgi:hypothetical protein